MSFRKIQTTNLVSTETAFTDPLLIVNKDGTTSVDVGFLGRSGAATYTGIVKDSQTGEFVVVDSITLTNQTVNDIDALDASLTKGTVSLGTLKADTITSPSIPTDVSDLTDTTGLLTHFSGSYNDLTDKPIIPTVPANISAFTNDAGYLTSETDSQTLSFSNGTLSISGGNNVDLTSLTPSIPTNVSEFTNDSGYITNYSVTQSDVTQHQASLTITESQISDLQNYQTAGNYVKYYEQANAPTSAPAGSLWKDTDTSVIYMAAVDNNVLSWFEI